ncbi:ParA family protein [Spiroplasma taiwanense]|uniref:SOJ-like protein n=1 Tax=Spiroplasma taiwanense CT-1 TaxID=1276220 RepID=S5M121_9MOLU|nr:AAA family ATPase [Spiroplasma taiwanense]AGR41702.1 SOJ-like protein [Spiroplasma taiwanense CT-1]
MKKITFTNSKGGVGKTTITLNVANALAKLGKKVLIFDFDSQANISLALQKNWKSNKEIIKWFQEDSTKEELLLSIEDTDIENIFLVGANRELSLVTMSDLNSLAMGELILKQNFKKIEEELKQKIDYILMDTSPTMSKILLNVLLAADEIIIPIEPHKFSIEGLETITKPYNKMIKTLNDIGSNIKNNINYYVVNKIQKNVTHKDVMQWINTLAIANKILNSKIPFSTIRQKETMINKFSLTDKSPFLILVEELFEKGIL